MVLLTLTFPSVLCAAPEKRSNTYWDIFIVYICLVRWRGSYLNDIRIMEYVVVRDEIREGDRCWVFIYDNLTIDAHRKGLNKCIIIIRRPSPGTIWAQKREGGRYRCTQYKAIL